VPQPTVLRCSPILFQFVVYQLVGTIHPCLLLPFINSFCSLNCYVFSYSTVISSFFYILDFTYFYICFSFNLLITLNILKPTGHVMHQQFNIQQLYVLATLYLCVLYLSENKQRLVPLTA
jgi:hypothetical protein